MEKELFMISPPHKDCLFATLLEKGWPTHTQTTTTTSTTTTNTFSLVISHSPGEGGSLLVLLEKVFYIILK
jgi:hypothetical protein